MIKSVITYVLVVGVLFFTTLNLHAYFIEKEAINLPFSLQKVYVFHAIFTLVVLIQFKIASNTPKIFEQLGFIYLAILILKIVLFCIAFYNPVLIGKNVSKIEGMSLLIPAVVFLAVEVSFVSRILHEK